MKRLFFPDSAIPYGTRDRDMDPGRVSGRTGEGRGGQKTFGATFPTATERVGDSSLGVQTRSY